MGLAPLGRLVCSMGKNSYDGIRGKGYSQTLVLARGVIGPRASTQSNNPLTDGVFGKGPGGAGGPGLVILFRGDFFRIMGRGGLGDTGRWSPQPPVLFSFEPKRGSAWEEERGDSVGTTVESFAFEAGKGWAGWRWFGRGDEKKSRGLMWGKPQAALGTKWTAVVLAVRRGGSIGLRNYSPFPDQFKVVVFGRSRVGWADDGVTLAGAATEATLAQKNEGRRGGLFLFVPEPHPARVDSGGEPNRRFLIRHKWLCSGPLLFALRFGGVALRDSQYSGGSPIVRAADGTVGGPRWGQ